MVVLPTPVGPHQGGHGFSGNSQIDILKNIGPLLVVKADIVKTQLTLGSGFERDTFYCILNLRFLVKKIADPFCSHHSLLGMFPCLGKSSDWLIEHLKVEKEGHQIGHRESPVKRRVGRQYR
jgi:hypothetical protein